MRFCDPCGQRYAIGLESPGVANHLTDDGEIDHDADADHTAYGE